MRWPVSYCWVLRRLHWPGPGTRRLRLLRVSDAAATWATRWIRRLTVVTVFGFAIAEVGAALGMSTPAYDGLLKICGLIDHLMLGVMVLQSRRTVRDRVRAPAGATGPVARLRNALAPVWHWIALFALAAAWVGWALEIRNGFVVILRFFLIAVVDLALILATRSAELSEADLDRARAAGLTDDEIWDVGAITALFAMSNRLAHLMALRPNAEFYTLGRQS